MPAAYLDENETRTSGPTARSIRSAPIAASAARSPTTSRTSASSTPRAATGRPTSNRLCVKGRFGFDYIHHPHRLTKPLIRLPACRKHADDQVDPANPLDAFPRGDLGGGARRSPPPASKRIRDAHGPKALAGFGSAKGSNEEAYLFQKLVRTGFGSNNVDHCTRLCHASSVAALMEGLNSGAVTAPFSAALDAEVIIVIGANPTVNHPVAATFIKNAVQERGAKLIVMDPRGQALSRHATTHLAFKPGTRRGDAQRHAAHVIIEEGLTDEQYIAGYTEGFEALQRAGQGLLARGDGAGLRHRRRDAARGRAALRPLARLDHLLGHGHLASTCTAPTTPAA